MEKYCPNCRTIIKAPPTNDMYAYAKYWRDNKCYICNTKLIERKLNIEQTPIQQIPTQEPKMEEEKSSKNIGIIILAFVILFYLIKYVTNKEVSNQNESQGTYQFKGDNSNQFDYNKPINLSLSIKEIKKRAISIPYEKLYRYNESYLHKVIYIKGQIVQTFQSGGYTTGFRIATKKDYYWYYDNIIYVDYDGSTRLMENDYIEVWGEVMGLFTYTTIVGSELTIPRLYSLHCVLLNKNRY